MTRHTRFRAALLLAVVLVVLLAAAVSAEESEGSTTEGSSTPRIVGGVETEPGEYPFIAAVVFAAEPDTYWGQFCAGTLIDPWWVLTAGHCVSFPEADKPWEIDVVIGRHDLRNGIDGERIGVAEIVRHPLYDDWTLANDLALLRLERPATAGTPIPLATAGDAGLFEPGDIATVIGWGFTKGEPPGTPSYPDKLREVDVPIVANADCKAAYGAEFMPPGQICAGDLVNGGVDSCWGDSGGPLFVPTAVAEGATGYLHVGIVSTGNDCALPGYPGIYTRTAVYTRWVEATLAARQLPSCRGQVATLLGSSGPDVLEGTAGDDVIVAREGDDTIYGNGGNDLICAGEGSDWADGGGGDDTILGGLGLDYLLGGPGADVVGGESGSDEVLGGDGADVLFGGVGPDTVRGEVGDDLIYGNEGSDRLFGGDGADQIEGLPGNDSISGGTGNDILTGGGGFDLVRGGLGTDTCSGEDLAQCEAVRMGVKQPL